MRFLISTFIFLILSVSVASANLQSSDVIVTVDSTNLRFSPSEVTVQEGQAVRFMWSGQALPHNAVADDGTFDSGEPARDVDYRFVFEIGSAGTYSFVCEPHESAGMVGQILVEPAPIVAAEEEQKEPEQTPSVSMISSIALLVLVANFHRSDEE